MKSRMFVAPSIASQRQVNTRGFTVAPPGSVGDGWPAPACLWLQSPTPDHYRLKSNRARCDAELKSAASALEIDSPALIAFSRSDLPPHPQRRAANLRTPLG